MLFHSVCSGSFLGLTLALASVCSGAENWTQFRGGDAYGVASAEFPSVWSPSTNVRWKAAVEGEGWSCPVVWGDNVFLTAAVPENTDPKSARPQPYISGGGERRSDLTNIMYRWEVICLDAATGRLRWKQKAKTGRPPIPRHSSNSYATETPATDGERVYAYFGMTGLYCFDMQGKPLWSRDLGTFEMRAGWGTSSSPLLYNGKLFLQVDNEQQSFVAALDAASGEEIWRVNRDESSQYSSPIVWQNSQRAELIVGGLVYRSYDPATGKLLWQLDMAKGRSSATPVASGDRLYVGTEFRNRGGDDDGGGYLFAVKPGGSGDITPPADGERVFCLDDGGTTHVLAGGPEFKVLGRNELGEQTWSSPAVANGAVYVRTIDSLYCIAAE